MLSETVCWYTIKVCKKIIEAGQWKIFYLEVTYNLASEIVPSQAIDLPIFPSATPIERIMDFNSVVKLKIAPVINNRFEKIIYQEIAIKELLTRFSLSNMDKTKMKKIIIELLSILQENKIIESRFQLNCIIFIFMKK